MTRRSFEQILRDMPLDHDVFAAINDEIMRIQAKEYRHERHHFKLDDEGSGNAALRDLGRDNGFHWRGPASDLLARLRKVPSGGGSDAIRKEFVARTDRRSPRNSPTLVPLHELLGWRSGGRFLRIVGPERGVNRRDAALALRNFVSLFATHGSNTGVRSS